MYIEKRVHTTEDIGEYYNMKYADFEDDLYLMSVMMEENLHYIQDIRKNISLVELTQTFEVIW